MSAARTRRSRSGRASTREKPADAERRQTQEVERLKRESGRLRDELAKRDHQIADLERQLALRQQNSTTSSKPPSSDGLAGRQRERGRRKKSRVSPLSARASRARSRGDRRIPAPSSHGTANDWRSHHRVSVSSRGSDLPRASPLAAGEPDDRRAGVVARGGEIPLPSPRRFIGAAAGHALG